MKIEFKRIELRNFMSYAEESFDFTACHGMNLIQGKNNDVPGSKNGAGKSQLWAAIAYALFGQMQVDMKNKNIVSRASPDNTMDVVLELSVDSQTYKIRRGISKGNASYLTLLEVDSAGIEKDITKSTIAETQKHIEENLIKLDVMMFFRTILLTSDQAYNFYKMKKSDKKEFVEKLFDISMFEEMHKALHKDLLSLGRDMDACQAKLLVLSKNNDDYASKSSSYEALKKQKLDAMQKDLKIANDKLANVKEKQASLDRSTETKLENAISALMESYENSLSKQSILQKKANGIDLEIHKLDESMKANGQVISKHKDVLSKLCSKCKDIFIKHYSLDEYANGIKDAKSKISILSESKKSVKKDLDECIKNMPTIKEKISTAKSKLNDIRSRSDDIAREVMFLESQIKTKQSSISQLEKESNPYSSLVEQCKVDISIESKKVSTIEEKSKYLKFAESIVSQETIRKFIIKDLVVLLNNKVKTYLTKLGANYYVEFDEDMDYEFITPTGTCEWGNFSAGERARIMIATSFAFRDFMSIRNGLASSILVLDEYFDSAIDTLCVESILSLLKEFNKEQGQDIFVVTHRQEVTPDMFDRTILIEKTHDIAKVNVLS